MRFECLFKRFLTLAEDARNAIFNVLSEKNPSLKPYQIWSLYDPWDETIFLYLYEMIPAIYGGIKFISRLNSSRELQIFVEFSSWENAGKFLDRVLSNGNSIIELEKESWKLSAAEFVNPIDYDEKPEVRIIYEKIFDSEEII